MEPPDGKGFLFYFYFLMEAGSFLCSAVLSHGPRQSSLLNRSSCRRSGGPGMLAVALVHLVQGLAVTVM